MTADLSHVDAWVFDLDNTLYPSHCDLFAQIDVKMTEFVSRTLSLPPLEAKALQRKYYAEHGTTLSGLMTINKIPPEDFLDYVHAIDLAPLDGLPELGTAIANLPGKRYVFTNGSRKHAENITRKLKIDHLFDDMFDIVAADYAPKPQSIAFDKFFQRTGADPKRSAMFEDLAKNLLPAHQRGMTTVLVRAGRHWGATPDEPGQPAHVHHVIEDLGLFLGSIKVRPANQP